MDQSFPKVKIYSAVIDEFRPVTSPEQRKSWEERMKNQCAQSEFRISGDMQLMDTCSAGIADDCGIAL